MILKLTRSPLRPSNPRSPGGPRTPGGPILNHSKTRNKKPKIFQRQAQWKTLDCKYNCCYARYCALHNAVLHYYCILNKSHSYLVVQLAAPDNKIDIMKMQEEEEKREEKNTHENSWPLL